MWLPGGVRSGAPGTPFRRGGSQTRPRPVPVGRDDSARLSVGAAFGRPGVWGRVIGGEAPYTSQKGGGRV